MKSGTDSLLLFRTPVDIAPPLHRIGVEERNVFLGSCFAAHIGGKFTESHLHTLVNPLGVIYNPQSLARLLTTHAANAEEDFVEHDGLWHTWLGDSSLSRLSLADCRKATDEALVRLQEALLGADRLILTLGTSRCYMFEGRTVANCHRVPQSAFREYEASVEEMTAALSQSLDTLWASNACLQVVLTVSPYRYAKYGYHGSQLSKARLLLVADELCKRYPDKVSYFPAYEIVLDELRDYRFYAEDMLHPSAQAVDYIWQRLCDTWMKAETQEYLVRWNKIQSALNHRPLHPDSAAFQQFRDQLARRLADLKADYPHLRDLDLAIESPED